MMFLVQTMSIRFVPPHNYSDFWIHQHLNYVILGFRPHKKAQVAPVPPIPNEALP